jgi:Fe2+ transport system protein FeoA
MPIAFDPPTHAPHGTLPTRGSRSVDDDPATLDIFTQLLLAAASVTVAPLPEDSRVEAPLGAPLSGLRPGEAGRVVAISRRCRAPERRRLMDLGVLPGTVIRAEMISPTGDPTAYRVRGALIALRAAQAQLIRVERLPNAAAA